MGHTNEFELSVPIDAPKGEEKQEERSLQVVLIEPSGRKHSQKVKVAAGKRALARFQLAENPGKVELLVGPAEMSEQDMEAMQTIRRSVVTARVKENKLELAAIAIGPYYWRYWLSWCRTFRIRGRVLCPTGAPVPGATVCAEDVDLWWWWSSTQQIACATTDANGEFELTFKWCCGYWPWWWWKTRLWKLEPWLAERIMPALRDIPQLRRIPEPTPKPKFETFKGLLELSGEALPVAERLDPSNLDALRNSLVKRLPEVRIAEQLRLWPWWPWYPWWDCTPDVIFKVTQVCEGVTKVIIDEQVADLRSNIPQDLSVTLVATDACCIQDTPDPLGNCVVIGSICGIVLDKIAGNPGAPAASPAGYVYSSTLTPSPTSAHDRPFGGRLDIEGLFGVNAQADYYEFESSEDGGITWNVMPVPAAGGFTRVYWGPKVGTSDPPAFHSVTFNFTDIDGRHVCKSRQRFETENDPTSWGLTRFWVSNRDMLIRWETLNVFDDGTYRLRVRTWQLLGPDNLGNGGILPFCDKQTTNEIVVTIDNRFEGSGSGHPTSATHPCGPDTVHFCTREPDTDVLRILVDGVPVDPCSIIQGAPGKEVKIEFLAHDPDGHLGVFDLSVHYAENLLYPLLPLGTLTAGAGVSSPVPAAVQVGPDYGAALAQGASAPSWKGGTMTLTIPNMQAAFPITCAYTLELRAHKRTIVSCDTSLYGHWNRSEYSFTVQY